MKKMIIMLLLFFCASANALWFNEIATECKNFLYDVERSNYCQKYWYELDHAEKYWQERGFDEQKKISSYVLAGKNIQDKVKKLLEKSRLQYIPVFLIPETIFNCSETEGEMAFWYDGMLYLPTIRIYELFYDNEKMLEFVLAHEIAHAERTCNNLVSLSRLGITSASIFAGLLFLIKVNLHEKRKWKEALDFLVYPSVFLTCAKKIMNLGRWNQKEEKACDLRAMQLCGTNEGAIAFFEKLIKKEKKNFYFPTAYQQLLFNTHPTSQERLAYCKNYSFD